MAGGWFARSARRGGLDLRRVLDLRIPARPDLPRARGVGRRRGPPIADRIVEIAARCHDRGSVHARTSLPGRGGGRARQSSRTACGASTTPWCRSRPARSRPCPPESSTAGSSRRAWTPSTCSEPRSGPRHSPRGARGNRSSCPTGASASSTGHRSSRLAARWHDAVAAAEDANRNLADAHHPAVGAALYQLGDLHRLRGEHAAAERARSRREPTGTGAGTRPRAAAARAGATSPRRSASINVSSKRRRGQRCHAAMLAAAVESCSPRATRSPRGASPRSSGSSSTVRRRSTSRRSRRTPSARSCSPRGTPRRPSRSCGARTGPGADSACRTTPHAPVRRSPEPAGRSPTTTPPPWSSTPRWRSSRASARAPTWPGGRLAGAIGSSAGRAHRPRQCDVLESSRPGMSNREVAETLGISEHTVARHLQNIFVKLGFSSRAAATAYAHQHGLV